MTQYGGEGLPWIGLSPYTTKKHIVQNMGDGSYFHSSHQNIRFAVTTGQRMTFRILYNGVIANTGGQDYAEGNSVTKLCSRLELDGVKKIVLATKDADKYKGAGLPSIVELRGPDAIPATLKEFEDINGVTVVIYDGDCANERRRRQKRGTVAKPTKFTVVNEDVCENCGDCGRKANCMSLQKVETPFGLKTQIHQSSCNQDRACVDGECPSFVSVHVEEGTGTGKVEAPDLAGNLPEPARPSLDKPFAIYLPGVGGTGVITLNAMLAQAAVRDGLNVKTYDQTGAAQKWGAVLSSIIVSKPDQEIVGNKVAAGRADLYLAADMVAGAENANLAVCDPDRTVAVVSTDTLPTGQMIRNVFFQPDKTGMVAHIGKHVRPGQLVTTPALTIAERLFGNYILSNMVTVGAAFQAGYLPISAQSIEETITKSGTSARSNILAFRAGRMSIVAPEELQRLMDTDAITLADRTYRAETRWPAKTLADASSLSASLPALPADLRDFVKQRSADLIAYQGQGYARRYVGTLKPLADAEAAGGNGFDLTGTAARYLHKIMAYKDEYEVARLLTDPIFEERLRKRFPGMKSFSYNLQPPTIRGIFPDRKIELGQWFRPALLLLSRMKGLRGTKFDPFARNPARRAERDAVSWYEGIVREVAQKLTPANVSTANQLLSLPENIRGYEELKTISLDTAKTESLTLLAALSAGQNSPGVVSEDRVLHEETR